MSNRMSNPETGEVVEWHAPSQQWLPVASATDRGEGMAQQIKGALNTFGSGLSMGLNDEAAGVLNAIPALVPGGRSPQEAYVSGRDAVRQSKEAFSGENPNLAMMSEMAGGLVTGGLGGAKAAGMTAVKNLSPAMRTFGGGAAGGAVTGYGESEATDPMQLATDTATGAGFGAAAGPVLGKVGELAGKGLSSAGRGLMTLFRSPEDQAQHLLRDLMNETGMDMATLQRRMQELGPDSVLADASDATRAKLRVLADTDLPLSQRARDVMDTRQEGASSRLVNDAQQTMGVPSDRFTTSLEAIDDVRRAQAKQQYGPIYDRAMPVDDAFEELLQRPSISAGYKKALKASRDAGEPMTMQIMPDGSIQGAPTLAEIDKIKRGIDSVINDNTDPITGKMNSDARTAVRAKKALLDYVDKGDPEIAAGYRQARSTYAGLSAREDAMRQGRNIFREDAERTEIAVGKMGEDEREAFRVGAFNAVRDEIESAIDTADIGRRKTFFTKAMRRRLRHAFGSDQQFEDFIKAVERERAYAASRKELEGGSPTARYLAQQKRQEQDTGGEIINPQSSLAGVALTLGNRALRGAGPSMEVTQRMGDMLLDRNLPQGVAPNGAGAGGAWFNAPAAAYGAGMSMYNPEYMSGLLGN